MSWDMKGQKAFTRLRRRSFLDGEQECTDWGSCEMLTHPIAGSQRVLCTRKGHEYIWFLKEWQPYGGISLEQEN